MYPALNLYLCIIFVLLNLKYYIMNCELSKMDLWRLLRGTEPPTFKWVEKLEKLGLGTYLGGFSDRWEYNSIFAIPENLSEEEMWELYKQMRVESEEFMKRIGKTIK